MEPTDKMDGLYDEVTRRLSQATREKAEAAISKIVAVLEKVLKSLQPSQKELKQALLTDETAMKIREMWNGNKKLFDLTLFAKELKLPQKKPSLDHILIGYYYPTNRLHELMVRFERIILADPSREKILRFKEWRARIRSLSSHVEMSAELRRIVEQYGVGLVREFAEHFQAKDLNSNKKLPKNAKEERLIGALSAHLWREKQKSRAQEGP